MERLISRLKELSPAQRLALLVVIPALLILYVWFMMVSPALDEKSRIEVEIKKTKEEVERLRSSLNPAILQSLRKQEEQLREEYTRKYEELTALVGEIPTEKSVGKLISNISRIARKSGMQIIQIEMSPPQEVRFVLSQEGERKLVKEVSLPREPQQQPQQVNAQQVMQAVEGVPFLRSELKLSLIGNYRALRTFMEGLRKEGIISYPSSLSVTTEGDRLKADLTIYVIMKKEEGP